MTNYSSPRCPKCNSQDNFRTWNPKTRQDYGFCRRCKKVTGTFEDFEASGVDFDDLDHEPEFDKDKYYQLKESLTK